MANLNQVSLMGYLGASPEIRTMPNGMAVANLSLATSKSWTDKISGEKREQTQWHKVVVFGRTAEFVGQYVKKGSNVFVQGELIYEKWQDKQGVEHNTAKVQATTLQLLGGSSEPTAQAAPQQAQSANQPMQNQPPAGFDGIPF